MYKKICGFLLTFALPFCTFMNAHAETSTPLYLGVYEDGGDLTEPRPKSSQYLQTARAGFQVKSNYAGFIWWVDITHKIDKRMYTRSIIQNPKDKNKPFIYEHYIDPETGSTTIQHGPAIGLEIFREYTLSLVLYEDEKRTQEIDRLDQQVRSYLDTTEGQISEIYNGVVEKKF